MNHAAMFGDEPEAILTIMEGAHGGTRYPTEPRRYRMAGGVAGQAVAVSVHPDPRAQALMEQIREREVEQMVGRLRLVHRTTPARVFLLSNVPTALPVDRLVTWASVFPSKMEQAIAAGRGVVPLSAAELARAHSGLWANGREIANWMARKGTQVPIKELIGM